MYKKMYSRTIIKKRQNRCTEIFWCYDWLTGTIRKDYTATPVSGGGGGVNTGQFSSFAVNLFFFLIVWLSHYCLQRVTMTTNNLLKQI